MKFILLINVKMPTIVGILTFISRISATSEYFKQKKKCYFSVFYSLGAVDMSCSAELSMKKVNNLWACILPDLQPGIYNAKTSLL